MTLESDILSEIKPTEEESAEILGKAERLKVLAEGYLSENGIDAEVRFVGSVGKGTYLRNPDIDLFLLFPMSTPKAEMERLGLKAGKDLIGGSLMFAEHPYTSGMFEGLEVDLVPCFRLDSTEHMKSSVDRTPFHADFILSRTDDRLKDEIRLMKRFMKGIGAYGAEPDIRGFSGYLCELIAIRYGGFLEAVEACSRWKIGIRVCIDEMGEPMKDPLVFYDPVDVRRNVASAVHKDTLCLFIEACRSYLAEPDRRFFFPNERIAHPVQTLKGMWESRGTGLISLTFDSPDILPENLHAQVWKTQYRMADKFDEYGFGFLRAVHGGDGEKVSIVFELASIEAPRLKLHQGPPVSSATGGGFLDKWRGSPFGDPFIEDGRWTVLCRPQYRDAAEMACSESRNAGLGKNLDIDTMEVMTQQDVIDNIDPLLLSELFDHRFPWQN